MRKVISLVWALAFLVIAVSIAMPVIVAAAKALAWIILICVAIVAARVAFKLYMDNR